MPSIPADNNLAERFFRERRFLLVVSLLLLLHQVLNVRIDNSAETLGLKFVIDNPERLVTVVWVIWAWTFICCVQQVNTLGWRRTYPQDIADAHLRQFARWTNENRVRSELEDVIRTAGLPPATRITIGGELAPGSDGIDMPIMIEWDASTLDEAHATDLMNQAGALNFNHIGLVASGGGNSYDRKGRVSVYRQVKRSVSDLVKGPSFVRNASRLRTFLVTSFATDYVLPLVIGLLPVLYPVGRSIWHLVRK